MKTIMGCRPVRIFIAVAVNNPISMVIDYLLWKYGNPGIYCLVQTEDEADLVIFSDPEAFGRVYDYSKTYAFLSQSSEVCDLPISVVNLAKAKVLSLEFKKLIEDVWCMLKPLEVETP